MINFWETSVIIIFASEIPFSVSMVLFKGGVVVSVKDIISILDKIPIWKQLKELPGRVEELEQRLALLENKPVSTGDICPKCKNETFELISTEPDPLMGQMGIQLRKYKCSSCNFEESKSIDTFSS